MADSTTPGGVWVLAVCAVLIYVPTLLVDAAFVLADLVRAGDDNLHGWDDQ